jgi:spermidine/putrescine transport system ATP-binding protein
MPAETGAPVLDQSSSAIAVTASAVSALRSQRHAVELESVSHSYAGVPALRGVSLQVREGEFFSLLGPSGCGKSSTLNVIGGFIEPSEGDVRIQQRSMRGIPPHRRPVNTVFQNYALFPHMSVTDNVAFGPRMSRRPGREIAAAVRDALALVSLSGMDRRRPAELSGGQQQRVALARALVNRPAVLLLDEPLGALDMKLRKQMQIELGRIQREVGITFVYVTHDQEEAMTMSDRIAVMDHGMVAQVGSPQDIYDRPETLFVADFIGSSNILKGEITGRDQIAGTVRLSEGSMVQVPSPGEAPGRPVAVVVRPDHMRLAEARRPGENSVAGKVTKVSYLGTHRQVAVLIGGGSEITVRQLLDAGETVPDPGGEVLVCWPVARSLCFNAAPHG